MSVPAAITIVGLGSGGPESRTVAGQRALDAAAAIILNAPHVPETDHLFTDERVVFCNNAASEDELLQLVTERVISAARSGPVVYAVMASPFGSDAVATNIIAQAGETGLPVSILPAADSIDVISAMEGFTQPPQRLDAGQIAAIVAAEPFSGGQTSVDPARPLIVSGFGDAGHAAAVKQALLRLFPKSHGLMIVRDPFSPDSPLIKSTIGAIDSELLDHDAVLVVPPLDWLEASRSPATLFRIIGQLRSPAGCPWDREQTHVSLSDKVLEEAHEVADAIASGSADALRDELGDLLLLVALHAQIAEEAGEFTIEEVLASVNQKLVRRHPHVFGDVVANTPDEVLSTWKRVKSAEQASTGAERPSLRYDQLPRSMSVIGRIRRSEEIDQTGLTDDQGDLGRRLLALVHEGLEAGIDPERALEAAYRASKLEPTGSVD